MLCGERILALLPSVGNENRHQLVSTNPLPVILNEGFSSDEDIRYRNVTIAALYLVYTCRLGSKWHCGLLALPRPDRLCSYEIPNPQVWVS